LLFASDHIRREHFTDQYLLVTSRPGHILTCTVLFQADDKSSELGGGSSDEDEQETGDVDGLSSETSGEDKELKNRLLNKYSGYLSSLWRELSRKKKKGKLPRDARQKLLHWWQLHYRWPYPSVRTTLSCLPSLYATKSFATTTMSSSTYTCMQELEKAALADSTGLDAKQINNWFINQRKRHWKPAPPPMLASDYRLHQHGGASSSSAHAALRAEGQYFAGGSAYPRGP
jgi:hypothetical protein